MARSYEGWGDNNLNGAEGYDKESEKALRRY
jgi:hypothetical protein